MVDTFSNGACCCRAVLLPAGACGRHGELGHLPHLLGGPAGGQAVPLLPPPPQQQQQQVVTPPPPHHHNPGHVAEDLAGVKSQRCDPKRIVAGAPGHFSHDLKIPAATCPELGRNF